MAGMGHDPERPASSAEAKAMAEGMAEMDRGMARAPITNDADQDFVAMMIPHHQGAVSMAETELKYGKDPALRKLATNIIAAQRREIGQMQGWQAAHPVQQSEK